MKTIARIILVFLGLLFIGGALFLLGINYDLVPGLAVAFALPGWIGENVILVIVAILLFFALLFLVVGLRSPRKESNAVLRGSEYGEVLISITAVENMVLRVVQKTQGIKDVSRKVAYTPDGLIINVRIRVLPDVSIPGLITELQSKIKEYLEEITGITVHEVKVMVENIVIDQVSTKK